LNGLNAELKNFNRDLHKKTKLLNNLEKKVADKESTINKVQSEMQSIGGQLNIAKIEKGGLEDKFKQADINLNNLKGALTNDKIYLQKRTTEISNLVPQNQPETVEVERPRLRHDPVGYVKMNHN